MIPINSYCPPPKKKACAIILDTLTFDRVVIGILSHGPGIKCHRAHALSYM